MIIRRQRVYSYCDSYYLGDDNCYYYPQQRIFFKMPNFGGFMSKVGAGIKNKVGQVGTVLNNTANRVGSATGNIMMRAGDKLAGVGFKNTGGKMIDSGAKKILSNEAMLAKRAGVNQVQAKAGAVDYVRGNLKQGNSYASYTRGNNAKRLNSNASRDFNDAWNTGKSVTDRLSAVPNGIKGAYNSVKSGISSAANKVGSAATGAYNSVKSGVNSAANKVGSAATGAYNSVKSGVNSAANSVRRAGGNVMASMGDRMSKLGNKMVDNGLEMQIRGGM